MIRTASQQPAIEKLGHGQPGKLSVLVRSVADVKTEDDARSILQEVRPDWVVWSAGKYLSSKHSPTQACKLHKCCRQRRRKKRTHFKFNDML